MNWVTVHWPLIYQSGRGQILVGGFWPGTTVAYHVYLPLVGRGF